MHATDTCMPTAFGLRCPSPSPPVPTDAAVGYQGRHLFQICSCGRRTETTDKSNIAPDPGGHRPQRPCARGDMCKTGSGAGRRTGANIEPDRRRSNLANGDAVHSPDAMYALTESVSPEATRSTVTTPVSAAAPMHVPPVHPATTRNAADAAGRTPDSRDTGKPCDIPQHTQRTHSSMRGAGPAQRGASR